MIKNKTLGERVTVRACVDALANDKLGKSVFEVAQEKTVVRAGEQIEYTVVIFVKMFKEVEINGLRRCAVENMIMLGFTLDRIENMTEQFAAKLL